jgi:hypothetical protein
MVNHLRMSRFISHCRAFPCRMFRLMVLISLFRICSACGKPIEDAFVRALGVAFHLRCFKCMVCSPLDISHHAFSHTQIGLW